MCPHSPDFGTFKSKPIRPSYWKKNLYFFRERIDFLRVRWCPSCGQKRSFGQKHQYERGYDTDRLANVWSDGGLLWWFGREPPWPWPGHWRWIGGNRRLLQVCPCSYPNYFNHQIYRLDLQIVFMVRNVYRSNLPVLFMGYNEFYYKDSTVKNFNLKKNW